MGLLNTILDVNQKAVDKVFGIDSPDVKRDRTPTYPGRPSDPRCPPWIQEESPHDWQYKRSYDLPGPRPHPEVKVFECSQCEIIMETSNWHEPNPQYFDGDTKGADRLHNPECSSKMSSETQ